jgi:hypothetical protein
MYLKKALSISSLAVAAGGLLFAIARWGSIETTDIHTYFNSSRWIIEGGRLYREVPSEYPLAANVVFATWRLLANLVSPGMRGFEYAWVISTGLIYLWATYRVATGTRRLATLAWIAPAPIYFALYRFDIYPAVATLLALFAIRRNSYLEGAIWLGVGAALKGYLLFLIPAFCMFMICQRSFLASGYVCILIIAPMMVSLLVTTAFAGWMETLSSFKFHLERGFNGESTYDAINYVFGTHLRYDRISFVPPCLQLGSALVAAAMRPKTFEDLVNAFIFTVLGFITFSAFYSPQYLIWILPLICFSDSRIMVILAIALSWLTFFYYPISYELAYGGGLFRFAVVSISGLRLLMIFLSVARGFDFRLPVRLFHSVDRHCD